MNGKGLKQNMGFENEVIIWYDFDTEHEQTS